MVCDIEGQGPQHAIEKLPTGRERVETAQEPASFQKRIEEGRLFVSWGSIMRSGGIDWVHGRCVFTVR